MKKTAILIITLFIIGITTTTFAGPYSDVRKGHWAYEAIKELLAENIIKDYPNNKIDSDKPITRYEMAQIVARVTKKCVFAEKYSPLQKLRIEFADELILMGIKYESSEEEIRAIRMDQEDMKKKLDHIGMEKIRIASDGNRKPFSKKIDNKSNIKEDGSKEVEIIEN